MEVPHRPAPVRVRSPAQPGPTLAPAQVTPLTVGPLPLAFVRDMCSARAEVMREASVENLDGLDPGAEPSAPAKASGCEGTGSSSGGSGGAGGRGGAGAEACAGAPASSGTAASERAASVMRMHRTTVMSLLRQRLQQQSKQQQGDEQAQAAAPASMQQLQLQQQQAGAGDPETVLSAAASGIGGHELTPPTEGPVAAPQGRQAGTSTEVSAPTPVPAVAIAAADGEGRSAAGTPCATTPCGTPHVSILQHLASRPPSYGRRDADQGGDAPASAAAAAAAVGQTAGTKQPHQADGGTEESVLFD